MNPSHRSMFGWLALTLALCATQASAGDIVFRDNFEMPVYYGWAMPFAGSMTVSAHTVLAYKVTIPSDTTLDRFGLVAVADSNGFTLALYTDAGGVPSTLEYSTTPSSMIAGLNESYVPYASLAAGVHWIAVRLQTNSAIGQDSAQTGSLCVRNSDIANIDDPWPSSFGPSSCSIDNLLNLYLVTFTP